MAITKAKKKEIYATLTDVVSKNPSLVFLNFHKLTVANATEVRRTLKANGIGYFVAKKSLIRKALQDAKVAGEMPALDGEVAVAYSTDLTGPARETYSFQKKLDGSFTILGGVFEGKFMNKAEMLSIATIPSQKTLYAMFVNVINSPIQGFVMALDQIAKKKETAPAA